MCDLYNLNFMTVLPGSQHRWQCSKYRDAYNRLTLKFMTVLREPSVWLHPCGIGDHSTIFVSSNNPAIREIIDFREECGPALLKYVRNHAIRYSRQAPWQFIWGNFSHPYVQALPASLLRCARLLRLYFRQFLNMII
jgi:hypothetical protein